MIKANDILDKDNKLMERFKDVVPGTEKHCRSVSILCEAISKGIDNIDSECLIAAALVHDIGKMCNPLYFSENQDSTNIHDDLDPYVSYQYISRHISDSVFKLVQHNVDQCIIRVVSEHHGDSVIRGIFNKVKNGNEDLFRYKSCKPTKIESCILMICDVVESACKSIVSTDKKIDFKIFINGLIDNLIDDRQLDIMTIRDIRIVKQILVKEIESLYHKRVKYDIEKDIEKEDNDVIV